MTDKPGLDLQRTLELATAVLKDPHATARTYREQRPPWLQTFLLITLPVYVAASVAGFVLSWLFGEPFMFGAMAAAPMMFLFSLVWSVAFVFVAVFIFDFFAGVFGGERNFDATFAALSLAMVPAVLGGVFSPLPWLGWLIGLAAGIYGLVLTYQFLPVFLTIPEDKRVIHFVVSLLVAFLVNMLVSGIVAMSYLPEMMEQEQAAPVEGSGGMFGDFERQADFAEQAAEDTYQPPSDGRLTESQVAAYARALERTAELRERLGRKLETMEEEGPSLGSIFSGASDAMRLGTAEMEVVKTAGGNWAEHQWVKNQIEIARVQRDSSPAVEHNYELFLEYRDTIEAYQ